MFGYIRPLKPELKVREFELYQSVYCGLCKQIGKDYGLFARFTLNYDFTFLTLLGLAISPEQKKLKSQVCIANPINKRPCMPADKVTRFCAAVAMIMIYYKIKDNCADSKLKGKLISYALLPFAAVKRKKAMGIIPGIDEILKEATDLQGRLEQEQTSSVDAAAHPSSNAMGLICQRMAELEGAASENEKDNEAVKKVLYRFGYLVGRYVYLTDALDDVPSDRKDKNFNPYLIKFGDDVQKIKDYADGAINLTVSQLAGAYELLDIIHYKNILDNIIYLGLKNTIKTIVKKELS